MTSLVTGASGFLGGRLTEMLRSHGEEVRALVRTERDAAALTARGVRCVIGGLDDKPRITEAAKGVRHIFHCAGLSSDWGDWASFYESNVVGVANLLEVAERLPHLARLVHVSTTDVYGYPEVACDERAAMRDVALPYNRSKCMGEQLVQRAHRETGLKTTIVRPASIYGPRSKDFVVEVARTLVAGLMPVIDGGHARAGLVYVDDVVTAMLDATASPAAVGGIYNLRHPEDVTWRAFFEAFAARLLARPRFVSLGGRLAFRIGAALERLHRLLASRRRPLMTRHAVQIFGRDQGFDIEHAKRDLGFAPRFDLDAGLDRTMAWLEGAEGKKAVPRRT